MWVFDYLSCHETDFILFGTTLRNDGIPLVLLLRAETEIFLFRDVVQLLHSHFLEIYLVLLYHPTISLLVVLSLHQIYIV